MVSVGGFAEAVRLLLESGFKFTVIGGTIVEISLKSRDLGDDIDVFAEEPSILDGEGQYYSIAEKRGWSVGQTWLGTPRLLIRAGGEEVPVEFYDNLYDFYVPESFLGRSSRVEVGGVRVKHVRLEDHIVLKANSGRPKDIDRLREIGRMIRSGRLRASERAIMEAASEFEEEPVIVRRLKEAGVI